LTMAVRIRANALSVTWTPFAGAVFGAVCSATGVIIFANKLPIFNG
jgi:hypothetical protein